ncbi:MAG: DUF2065 family protein [Candidatus Competibacteraceae bacterium]
MHVWTDLLAALGLLFRGISVSESDALRQTLLRLSKVNDRILRLAGLGSMALSLMLSCARDRRLNHQPQRYD